MIVKTDTKEKFIVLTPETAVLSANMTEDVKKLGEYATSEIPHLVINLKNIADVSREAAVALAELQQSFYEKDRSLVFCEMANEVVDVFDQEELMDVINSAPTESEASDILQMEEIERDLMKDFGDDEGGK